MPTRWDVEHAVVTSSLPASSRFILLTLCMLVDNQTGVIPDRRAKSVDEIAAATGLHRTTVMRHIEALEDDGWLTRPRHSRRRVSWTLAVPVGRMVRPNSVGSCDQQRSDDAHTQSSPHRSSKTLPQTAAFDAFWKVYPRRVGKGAAVRKWDTAVKAGVPPEKIIAGAQRYADAMDGGDPRFVAHPATWLHQGRWDDDASAIRPEAEDEAEVLTHAVWTPA